MLTLERLTQAVRSDAAIRRVRKLQPVGGSGDKIYPPTYPGEGRNPAPRHVFEHRRFNGSNVLCVLIDSVQSQANRLEEALRIARESGDIAFPAIVVDFTGTEVADVGRITTLDAPHRVFDAIIRDSELNGVRFTGKNGTEEGKRLIEAKPGNARAVFELSPATLVFGAWNSTGEGGGLGAKFPRTVVSEIIGVGVATETDSQTGEIDVPSGRRTGSRIDPLGIRSGVKVYKTPDGDWTTSPGDKKAKEGRPSEINHSNIAPTVARLGVSVDYALHSFVLSFAALRRLRFVGNAGAPSEADIAGQAALAALGLVSASAQDRAGYFLRSRCDLAPEQGQGDAFEIVRADGARESVTLDYEGASTLVKEAAAHASAMGLAWRDADLMLKPQAKLVDIVKQSREKALQGEAEAESQPQAAA